MNILWLESGGCGRKKKKERFLPLGSEMYKNQRVASRSYEVAPS